MLFPIGTDLHHKRYPTVTYVLIGVNLLIFALQWAINQADGLQSSNEVVRSAASILSNAALSGTDFHIYSLVTYQFIHASWWHVLGNMIFLLPFGKAVEDRLGHVGFACFYLGCGAIGGALHALMTASPVIGASGSVCAITASFIVLAPRTRIKVLLIFFIIGIYYIPSLLFVLFFVLFDTFSLLASLAGANDAPTAWLVHLGGYIFGFGITFGLLASGIIQSTQYDLATMFRQANRRRAYKKVVSEMPLHRTAKQEDYTPRSLLTASITQTAAAGNPLAAAKQYINAVNDDAKIKLDHRTLLMLGSALIQDGRIEDGVKVYEDFLEHHKESDERGEVALLLVAKYIRNLRNTKRARELLAEFSSDFSDNHQSLVATLSSELS